eukprot:CAMPEP_0174855328 /NCGR_PEP_ID=MMETSP1114-20130205/33015_1 /TAXON_ID=312471 /ORGANISM="Neobodo designis, Strain CCAP 1951/1" /LENGTH=541 /DNA_ID=CAMNT_0016090065 /DNA_START=56 /DNA_END=1681 /DNA_ORIENTATION=+
MAYRGGRFSPFTPEFAPNDFRPTVWYNLKCATHRRLMPSAFDYDTILRRAIEKGDLNRNRIESIPDEKWWRKLCKAAADKPTSRYGGHLLRDRITHFLANRLLVDEIRNTRKQDIEKETIKEPIFIIGMPRSQKHMVAHMYARGGYTFPLRFRDSMFIGIPNEEKRIAAGREYLKGYRYLFPSMQIARPFRHDQADDDTALQLQVPYSLGWGMLHGMSDYLYECIQEDHQPVYDHVRDCLQVLQFYRTVGENTDGVEFEKTTIDNPMDKAIDGDKNEVDLHEMPWVVHSPLGILHTQQLHKTFDDMKVIWTHRAVKQSVQSLASALCMHDSMYTGRQMRETGRVEMGEIVLGLFSSGVEHAVDYMGTFPKERMVHWSNRDIERSGMRLFEKTHEKWWPDLYDTFRKWQTVNGMTEIRQTFRPKNDTEIEMFGLHEGMLNDSFRAYIFQFEEYAFESKYGTLIQEYQPIAGTLDESKWGLFDRGDGAMDRVTSLEQMPIAGHLLQRQSMFRPAEYVMSRPRAHSGTDAQQQLPPNLAALPPK